MSVTHSMSPLTLCAFTLIIFAAILPQGSAVKCYRCTSLNDTACSSGLTTKPDAEMMKLTVDCDMASKDHVEAGSEKLPFTFCRKTTQDVDGRVNIIRDCGLIRGDKDCYSTASKGIKTTSCQCSEDYCNSAVSLSAALSLLLPLTVAVALFNH